MQRRSRGAVPGRGGVPAQGDARRGAVAAVGDAGSVARDGDRVVGARADVRRSFPEVERADLGAGRAVPHGELPAGAGGRERPAVGGERHGAHGAEVVEVLHFPAGGHLPHCGDELGGQGDTVLAVLREGDLPHVGRVAAQRPDTRARPEAVQLDVPVVAGRVVPAVREEGDRVQVAVAPVRDDRCPRAGVHVPDAHRTVGAPRRQGQAVGREPDAEDLRRLPHERVDHLARVDLPHPHEADVVARHQPRPVARERDRLHALVHSGKAAQARAAVGVPHRDERGVLFGGPPAAVAARRPRRVRPG